jgi:hypothetical protein
MPPLPPAMRRWKTALAPPLPGLPLPIRRWARAAELASLERHAEAEPMLRAYLSA